MLAATLLLIAFQSSPRTSPNICVANVANASTISASRSRLTERIVKSIERNKLTALAMDSDTTMQSTLRPTRANSDEADRKGCDYTLLTQIVQTRHESPGPQTAPRPGARIPSVDASDPMGGQSGPVYREETQIDFALFRISRYEPVVDDYVLERASATVSDTFLAGMDRIASRVASELKKK
jgi:hypothetical protein